MDGKQGKGTIAILGAAAAAVVLVLFGVLTWDGAELPASLGKALQLPRAQDRATSGGIQAPAEQADAKVPAPVQAEAPSPKEAPRKSADQVPASPAASKPAAEQKTAAEPLPPSFDIVRVEPNGDSVIAGRAAPGATIELLSDNIVHARSVADASGLFALTPPPLPLGSHQIVLQSIAPDGTRRRSRESVTVVVDGNARPLVALAAPDKPTVLLSNPEPPAPKAAENAPSQPDASSQKTETAAAEAPSAPAQAASAPQAQQSPSPRAEIKITSVETEQGRLYVSGQAAPGATVRLYLNETFVAPGGAGGDGKLSFAIGSGVRPGDYRVRLDDVDPVSGQVKSRAEVAFNVPALIAPAQQMAQNKAPAAVAPTAGTTAAPSMPEAAKPEVPGPTQVASALPGAQLAPNTVVVPNINTAIVSRGDSLWRISQRIYGSGLRYTVIYGANQQQIRNPDLIYPGQLFVLPSERAKSSD